MKTNKILNILFESDNSSKPEFANKIGLSVKMLNEYLSNRRELKVSKLQKFARNMNAKINVTLRKE
jgi:transcriptional regulator with XRE-family HTH domain